MFLSKAKAVFRDQEYDRALEHLQNCVPIYEYEKDIRLLPRAMRAARQCRWLRAGMP